MTGQFSHKKGNYYYHPDYIKTLNFGNRTFTVMISNAYDAMGLIGSEVNGIVVLDEDNRGVVFDRMLIGQPLDIKIKKFNDIVNGDWNNFSKICRSSDRFRGLPDDIANGDKEPEVLSPVREKMTQIFLGNVDRSGEDIRPSYMKNDAIFKEKTFDGMLSFLMKHSMKKENYQGGFLSWDIKMHGTLDTTGKAFQGDYNLNSEHDAAWNEKVENDNDMFNDVCSLALSEFMEGFSITNPNVDMRCEFATAGRSGGHLVLEKMNGRSMSFSSYDDYIAYLSDLNKDDLINLYDVVANVDSAVENRYKICEGFYASFRESFEEELRLEEVPKIKIG